MTFCKQVPVCPLCDKPVPTPKGTSPDATVSAHLDRDCRESAKRKIKNKCSVKKCKQSEFIKVECDQCRLNFCLKHRHPADHECQGKGSSKAAQAAMARQQRQPATTTTSGGLSSAIRSTAASTSSRIASMFQQDRQTINGQMTEDEALARALQASMTEQQGGNQTNQQQPITAPRTREEQDRMLAQAIAESQREANRGGSSSNDKSCGIS